MRQHVLIAGAVGALATDTATDAATAAVSAPTEVERETWTGGDADILNKAYQVSRYNATAGCPFGQGVQMHIDDSPSPSSETYRWCLDATNGPTSFADPLPFEGLANSTLGFDSKACSTQNQSRFAFRDFDRDQYVTR